jgi:hypothetical protein
MARLPAQPAPSALPPHIAAAFAKQAEFCRFAGSPLTALVCDAAISALDADSATGRAIIAWPGVPFADALDDAGHRRLQRTWCVQRRMRPILARRSIPPAHLPSVAAEMVEALARLCLRDPVLDAQLLSRVGSTGRRRPTKSRGRAYLMPGMMVVADRHGAAAAAVSNWGAAPD